jgi:hypothetical protein
VDGSVRLMVGERRDGTSRGDVSNGACSVSLPTQRRCALLLTLTTVN